MSENQAEDDGALEALDNLSRVAESSIDGLQEMNEQIAIARQQRRRGWSWQRIVEATDVQRPLISVTGIAANLGRASAEVRRSLATALRKDGLRVTQIGSVLGVSRQRASALLHSRRLD